MKPLARLSNVRGTKFSYPGRIFLPFDCSQEIERSLPVMWFEADLNETVFVELG